MKRVPTMKQLQYLVALADTEHFGRAAQRCFVTQSTLSAGIRDLEAALATTIAERSNRRVRMTRVGVQIAGKAKTLLRAAEEIVDMARAGSAPMTGDIRFGVIPTIGPFLLPRILPLLRERFPELTIYLSEEQTATLLDQLDDGELDVALIALPYETGTLDIEVIREDEFLFACDRQHALSGSEVVPRTALKSENLLLLKEGHCLRGHALDECGSGDMRVRSQFEASSLHTLVQLVAAGLGVTLIPRLAVDAGIIDNAGISLARLAAPASRQIGLAWRPSSLRASDFRTLASMLRTLTAAA